MFFVIVCLLFFILIYYTHYYVIQQRKFSLLLNNATEISTGSEDEGQMFAKMFFSSDGAIENDTMLVVANISDETCLEEIPNTPGFVRVKRTKDLPHIGRYVDGMRIKQIISDNLRERAVDLNMMCTGMVMVISPSLDQAAIRIRQYPDLDLEHFELKVRMMQTISEAYNSSYHLWKGVLRDIYNDVTQKAHENRNFFNSDMEMDSEPTPYVSSSLLCICVYPAFGIPLPRDVAEKAECLLKFYELVKSLVFSLPSFKSFCEKQRHPFEEHSDLDRVPCVCLDFDPHVLNWFLERHKMNSQRINNDSQCKVYLVAKSQSKSLRTARSEFRYSFSIVEKHLAINRRPMEKLLNSLARKFYYKIIRRIEINEKYLKSYFVKTSILWLCELNDIEQMVSHTVDDPISTKVILLELWINFVSNSMKKRYCSHYFVKTFNLLQD
ncbi:unnamed protein product [Didymodactylos carnosus]|nr:unnamed protein product [Didymodactylos carnosus]CAF3569001.1 unnamed protein product [Didymodactylos carnosus]